LDLGAGFIVSGCFSALVILLITVFAHYNWRVNSGFTFRSFLASFGWMLRSVLVEELVFRGAVLYIAIKRLGVIKGCILSAVAFGIYHWFSYEAFGNPAQMIYIFIITGIGGFMFAYAYAKTNSLYLPIGLHFGWNFVNVVIFSNGPLGQQLLIWSNGGELTLVHSIILFIFQTFALPAVVLWYLGFFKRKQAVPVPLAQPKKRL
jgi:membrane protease YdiL (CAAX protease family)